LLGDKDQLASVESGAMMSELGSFIGKQEKAGHFSPAHCSYIQQITGYELPYGEQHSAVSDSLCHLWKSRRFDGQSAIGQLAKLINEKKESWSIFEQHPNALHQITYPNKAQYADEYRWRQACVASIVKQAVACYRAYLEKVNDYVQWLQRNLQAVSKAEISAKIAEIFQCFNQVRFLSALREGDFGVEWLNIKIDETLKQQGIVSWQKNYFGKPVLITENAAQNHIYNGDIGLILPHLDGNGAIKARVYFEGEKEGERIHLSPNLLPANELAYVMTVHKSQGSEFAHTFLILPLADSPVLSKELIYTAVTRSLNEFTLFGEKGIWQKAVNRDLKRDSGLRSLLQRNNI
jgi:exodeoxyribonuclease V alpha subunit